MDEWGKKSQKPEDGTTAVALPHLKEKLNVLCVCGVSTCGLRLTATRVTANICEH